MFSISHLNHSYVFNYIIFIWSDFFFFTRSRMELSCESLTLLFRNIPDILFPSKHSRLYIFYSLVFNHVSFSGVDPWVLSFFLQKIIARIFLITCKYEHAFHMLSKMEGNFHQHFFWGVQISFLNCIIKYFWSMCAICNANSKCLKGISWVNSSFFQIKALEGNLILL